MEQGESKEDIYTKARMMHATLDRRLQILLNKPYITAAEEIEIRVLKKKKLYYKDMMEHAKEEIKEGEKH